MLWTVNWSANGAGYTNNNYVTIFSGTVTVKDANNNVLQTKSMSGQISQARKDVQIISGTFTTGVDLNGDRRLVFSATFRIGVNGASGESTGSQTFALDNIPLASTISSVSPSNVAVTTSGGAVTVNIARNNNAYTHRVVWSFGSHSTTQTGQGTSASTTIPASWLDVIPTATSGTATVTVTTYSGSTQIGTPKSASFTVTASVSPNITTVSVAPRGAAYNAGMTSVYISGYSTAYISASGVSAGTGATISKYEFIRDGAVLATFSSSATSYNYTTGTISGSSATFSVRVTDSRGAQATKSASSVSIAAYALPAFSSTQVYRSNSGGTADGSGTYIYIRTTATATPGANSITALTYATKPTTSSSYGTETALTSGTAKIASGFANTSSFDVRITATDKLGNKSYFYATIPTQAYTMDFKVGGDGVAFGKVAETANLVDSAWPIEAPSVKSVYEVASTYQSVANLTALNNAILAKYATMDNGSAAFLRVAPSASISPIGAYVTFLTIYKINSGYGAVEAISYQNASGANRHSASIWNNSVTGWV